MPWVDDTKTVIDTKRFVQDALDNKNAVHFGIRFNEKLVGVIGYHFIHKANKKVTIGYWLDKNSQGKGIMTTACKLIIDYGFEH